MNKPAIHCAYDTLVPLNELIPHPQNPNTHPEKQITLLTEIIRRQGWRAPIVVSKRSGFIVAGHGRLLAAKNAGFEVAPVNYQDFENNTAEMEHLLADNRIAELSDTDNTLLAQLIKSCPGIDATLAGYNSVELQKLIDSNPAGELAAAIRSEQKYSQDEAPNPQAVIDGLAGHIQRLAANHPERLKDAVAVILPIGRGHTHDCLILADPACSDAAAELRRHIDAGEKSPVASLMTALLPMKGDATP